MIGNVIGTYQITDKLGEGGMGTVFKGLDVMLERAVAIKMLRPELASQPQVVERFRTEAKTLAKLNHPNIATLYNFLRDGDDYFMALEYVPGETLEAIIKRFGAMSVERAVTLFAQALEGIEHAHRMNIIHRDLKPANLMLTPDGTIKVMDFGIARMLGTDRLTRHGNIIGTIEYMSPEAVRGEEGDARSDIYSLGILLYEMLTGRVPFDSPSEYELMRSQIEDLPPPPKTFAPHIPLAIEKAIMRSLAKRPEARFQSAADFRIALEAGLRGGTAAVGGRAAITRMDQAAMTGEVAPDSRKAAGTPIPSGERNNQQTAETRVTPVAEPAPPVKETALSAAAPVRETSGSAAVPPARETRPADAGAAQPSFFRKLTWAHYAGVGALVLALIGVPLALRSGWLAGRAAAPPAPPAQETPADQAPAAAQETPLDQAPAATEATPPASEADAESVEPPKAADSRPKDKSSRNAAAATPESPPAEQPETPAEPPIAQPAPPPPTEAEATPPKEPEKTPAENAENKGAAQNANKKQGGGFFKKLGRIFTGDKNDKNKNKNTSKPPQ